MGQLQDDIKACNDAFLAKLESGVKVWAPTEFTRSQLRAATTDAARVRGFRRLTPRRGKA